MKKITVSFLVDDRTDKIIRSSSLERVINTSIRVLEDIDEDGILEDRNAENITVNLEDWEVLQPAVMTMWHGIWNALFIETYPSEKEEEKQNAIKYSLEHPLTIKAGD